jgi:hypothetical protein
MFERNRLAMLAEITVPYGSQNGRRSIAAMLAAVVSCLLNGTPG